MNGAAIPKFLFNSPSDLLFLAEVAAIYNCLLYLSSVRPSGTSSVHIYSDSLSALSAIASRRASDELIACIHELLFTITKQLEIHMIWIPSHAGIAENEYADMIAKNATHLPSSDHKVPSSILKSQLMSRAQQDWQESWSASENGGSLHLFMPNVRVKPWFVTEKLTSALLMQFLTGHCSLRSYAYRISRSSSPNCRYGCGVSETFLHVLYVCPILAKERHQLSLHCDVINLSWPPDPSQFLSHPSLLRSLCLLLPRISSLFPFSL
jgi:hypothetical protein